jgi:integrase
VKDLRDEVDGTTVALIRRGRHVRAVKLKPEIVSAIRAYHEGAGGAGEWAFRNHSHRPGGGTGLTPKAVWLIVKSAAARAGIAKRVSPNSLRLTHITMALSRGCPLGRVQAAVGHSRPESTMRYGRLLDADGGHATDFVSFKPRRLR